MNEENKKAEFGKPMRIKFYALDPNLALTNHGSYGSSPKPILERKRLLQDKMENSPDMWFRFTMFDLWEKNLSLLSKYLRVEVSNILIGENATECINAILKSIEFDCGGNEVILTTNLNYYAILMAIEYTSTYRFSKSNQIHVHKIDLKVPLKSKDDIISSFDEACRELVDRKKLRLRLAVVDHISSATAILYPITEINKTIRKWAPECKILIDGAHALGQVNLELDNFGCDFYVSNLHKWFLAPRSCSFLYTSDPTSFNFKFQPCYISHGYHSNTSNNFCQRGTSDKTSWYLVEECVKFYENFLGGRNAIIEYTGDILRKAVDMLEIEWKTKRLEISEDLEAPFMRIVKLPYLKDYVIGPEPDSAGKVCSSLIRRLMDEFKVVCCVVCIENELYCRISCFVYNTLDDFVSLKDAILAISNNQIIKIK